MGISLLSRLPDSLRLIVILLGLASIAFAGSQPAEPTYPLQAHRYSTGQSHPGQQPIVPPDLLDVIEVDVPVKVPQDASCKVLLMKYSFRSSYGQPFVGPYTPPICDFDRVVLNFTSMSSGRQFDRLAVMYLNDTEIWRTSTAEPTSTGIIWTYTKDVSNFLALWRQPQRIIFDLGNVIDNTYTGPFNTTLTATFFKSDDDSGTVAADMIVPISARKSADGKSSAFSVPEVRAVNDIVIPRNVKRAVFSISACGQIDEEFWWSNVLSSDTGTFVNNTLLGYSPFREVQLLIDGQLAGVVWPFPIIFTGGIVPGFWRPLVGIDTYDLREDEIDITPWLSRISDGQPHSYEIKVLGLAADGQGGVKLVTVGNYWVVTGKMFLWLDDSQHITSGSPVTSISAGPYFKVASQVSVNAAGANDSLKYTVTAERTLQFASTINTSSGTKQVSWTQKLSYQNNGDLTGGGFDQVNEQSTVGSASSSSGFTRRFSYPITVASSFHQNTAAGTLNLTGQLTRGKDVQTFGPSVFPIGLECYNDDGNYSGAWLSTRQNGTAAYTSIRNKVARSSGTTEQDYNFFGLNDKGEGQDLLYQRHVLASDGRIVIDSNPRVNGGVERPAIPGRDDEDDDEGYDYDDDNDYDGDMDIHEDEDDQIDSRLKFAAPERGVAAFIGRHPT